MRLVGLPRAVFLLLFVAVLLVLRPLLQSISQCNFQFSPNPLFVFSLFNIIIVALIIGNHRPSSGEADDIIPFLYHRYDLEEDAADDAEDAKSDKYLNPDGYDNGSDHADDDDDDFDSDGYDEDDDDNGSDDEIGWGDMDLYDSNLEKRIQDFIDKVNRGWREERLRESLSNPLQFSYL